MGNRKLPVPGCPADCSPLGKRCKIARMRILGIRGLFSFWAGLLVVGLAAAILGGCSRAEPYVFRTAEFDRRVLGKVPVAVPGEIQVCYSKMGTSPDEIVRLAEEECAKYGKSAQFIGNEIYQCPLSTPTTARYYCCPSPVELAGGFRCSPAGGQVERMTADEIRREKKRPASAKTSPSRY